MSTMEVLATGWRAARAAARARRSARSGTRTRAGRLGQVVADHALYVTAAGCFVTAAAMFAIPAGLAVAGVALLVLEMRVGE